MSNKYMSARYGKITGYVSGNRGPHQARIEQFAVNVGITNGRNDRCRYCWLFDKYGFGNQDKNWSLRFKDLRIDCYHRLNLQQLYLLSDNQDEMLLIFDESYAGGWLPGDWWGYVLTRLSQLEEESISLRDENQKKCEEEERQQIKEDELIKEYFSSRVPKISLGNVPPAVIPQPGTEEKLKKLLDEVEKQKRDLGDLREELSREQREKQKLLSGMQTMREEIARGNFRHIAADRPVVVQNEPKRSTPERENQNKPYSVIEID